MDSKALFAISCGLYVVGVRRGSELGGCVVDALIQSTAYPATLILCSQKSTQTSAWIEESGEFSVSVLRSDVDPQIIATFGFQSRRVADKWGGLEYELRDGLPVLSSVAAWYTCKVKSMMDLGSHMMFHCDVTGAELGDGEPLTYGDYRARLMRGTAAAFQAMKKQAKAEE